MGFADIMKGIGKTISVVGKWALEHSGEIAQLADTGIAVHNELSEGKKNQENVQQYYALLEEENNTLKTVLQELGDNISELGNVFETSIDGIEKKYENVLVDLETLKQKHTESFDSLQNQMNLYREENAALQKKVNKQLVSMGVIGGIGIVAAILLAVLL